ncbi:hypothetical protein AVEN_93744-1 [Araneus ventricosus]|uniref:Uncharacterized protein n=1 Tax=Araneus ventricosus TaxID=182803 RepID=A0A4Y2J5F8_ARAVE|nr:hypothetical protein AVEN_93744-1 [Araneus ventricosus]
MARPTEITCVHQAFLGNMLRKTTANYFSGTASSPEVCVQYPTATNVLQAANSFSGILPFNNPVEIERVYQTLIFIRLVYMADLCSQTCGSQVLKLKVYHQTIMAMKYGTVQNLSQSQPKNLTFFVAI